MKVIGARQNRHIERRKYKRKSLYCLIKYRVLPNKEIHEAIVTSLRNMSGGGILFRTSEYLQANTILEIKINLPLFDKIVTALAKVVRTEKTKTGTKFFIGVQFTEIKDEDRSSILKIVEYFEKKTI